jgi:putative Holliday junction resolvase
VGSKTIGIAVSDELGIAAHPLLVWQRQGTVRDVAEIARLVAEYNAGDVVVGLPLDLQGRVGQRAKRVRVLITALGDQLDESVSIHEWDERFSTVAVEKVLIDGGVSRAGRKRVVDKQAAAFILQGWLDSRPRS